MENVTKFSGRAFSEIYKEKNREEVAEIFEEFSPSESGEKNKKNICSMLGKFH